MGDGAVCRARARVIARRAREAEQMQLVA